MQLLKSPIVKKIEPYIQTIVVQYEGIINALHVGLRTFQGSFPFSEKPERVEIIDREPVPFLGEYSFGDGFYIFN